MGNMEEKPDGMDAGPANEQRQLFRRRPPLAAALFASLALAGCQGAMTNPSNSPAPSSSASPASGDAPSTDVVATWPLRFAFHKFAAFCYSTYGCKVKYSRYYMDDPEEKLQLSSASLGDKYPKNLSAGWGGIRNFPPPAVVTWRSKDGTPLRAEIDMAEIFKDQLALHNLKREEVSANVSAIEPEVILEVNDRTINVYMRAMIWTREEQRPGHPHSRYRNDLIKAFSRTY